MTPASADMVSFATLKKGMRARVVQIRNQSEETVRLQEMGLTVGTEFSVVKVAPFGDPIEIELRGYRLCLRKRETDSFEIEIVA
jgi:ferrous iron transport protein A